MVNRPPIPPLEPSILILEVTDPSITYQLAPGRQCTISPFWSQMNHLLIPSNLVTSLMFYNMFCMIFKLDLEHEDE